MKYGVGIDVSKGKSTVAILSIEGEVVEMPFDINHDIEDLEKLDKKLQKFSKEDLKIVLEQTGTYHLPILTYLLDKGYCVIAENALKIKKYLDRSLRKAKTIVYNFYFASIPKKDNITFNLSYFIFYYPFNIFY